MYRKIALLLYDLFIINRNATAIQKDDAKYYTVKMPCSVELIEQMLKTGNSLGAYQQQYNNDKLKWLCLDFDCKNKNDDNLEDLIYLKKNYIDKFINYLEEKNIKYTLEFSGRRGIHIWLFLNQIISKNLGYAIIKSLSDNISKLISNDNTITLDLFPKTNSNIHPNKYGLMVKLPLSRHMAGTYSYFINKDEKKFKKQFTLNDNFLQSQYDILSKVEINNTEELIHNLGIEIQYSENNLLNYHKQIKIVEKVITLNEIKTVFKQDKVLKEIWTHIENGELNNLEHFIILGLFAHIKDGDSILYEILKIQNNYSFYKTKQMIMKYKNYYYPITFRYLYSLFGVQNCSNTLKNRYIDDYIYEKLGIPFKNSNIENISYYEKLNIKDIIHKEINYYLYNDECYDFIILNELQQMSHYDYCCIEEYVKLVEKGETKSPLKIKYVNYNRKEENKERILFSLGAKDRIITTVLAFRLIRLLQKDYDSYSYHLNMTPDGDIFFPWISSWARYIREVAQYFTFSIFEEYYCIKIDFKNFYDSIYIQSTFKEILSYSVKNKKEFDNIYSFLVNFNEKIMISSNNSIRGVPQGPAYARVLAELCINELIKQFFDNKKYENIKLYRYVDDVFIFHTSNINGEILLYELSEFLNERGLFFNWSKTKNYGQIKNMSLSEKNEIQDFKNFNYDLIQLQSDEYLNNEGKKCNNIKYLNFIYRKGKWDLNDLNIIFSSKVNNSLKTKYINKFYYDIIKSEIGRGVIFRKFYSFIFNDNKLFSNFLKNHDYEKIPKYEINYLNMIGIFILDFKNIQDKLIDCSDLECFANFLSNINNVNAKVAYELILRYIKKENDNIC